MVQERAPRCPLVPKNIIIVFQTDPRHGDVPGSLNEFYQKELKTALSKKDFDYVMKNNYVQFRFVL